MWEQKDQPGLAAQHWCTRALLKERAADKAASTAALRLVKGFRNSRGIKICWEAGPAFVAHVVCHAIELSLEAAGQFSLSQL